MKTLFGALYQTAWTLYRQWRVPCPWCKAHGRKASLRSVVTPRGYVLRCWQCGGEYVEKYGKAFLRVWPE